MNEALISSKNMNWCTPQGFFNELDKEFSFKLDAAAANNTAKGNASGRAPFPSMLVIYNGKKGE